MTLSGEDKISIFSFDPKNGTLEILGSNPVSGRPAPLALDPGQNYLYVGCRDEFGISSFVIDQHTGQLSKIGVIELDSDPCYLATDRTGRFLLSAYYNAGKVAIHSINVDGVVDKRPVQSFTTNTGAHSIQTDLSNRFAFVPHIADRGPNMILQFKFDEVNGTLTPNQPYTLTAHANAGPRHYCFHPTKNIAYFSNEQGSSVTVYKIDTFSGTLSPFQTVSTLPAGYQGSNTCAQIQIVPTGRFLYAPNRGHNTIAGFSVNDSTGELTPIGHTVTEPIPRAFCLDPSGRFLYAAGLQTGRLKAYSIDENSGELSPFETHSVGLTPMWVLFAGRD